MNEFVLGPGDLPALFTEGITEATTEQGDDHGDKRLIAALNEGRDRPAAEIPDSIIRAVHEFGGRDQADDLRLARVVALGED